MRAARVVFEDSQRGIKRIARAPVCSGTRSLLMHARRVALLALFALTVTTAPVRSADDKTKTPTLIVRVQSLDGLIGDARYLATLAGREEEGKQADAFLKQLTGEKGIEGLDPKRPMGLYGTLD